MTEDEEVLIGSAILERAEAEMIEAGIDANAVPHLMVAYATMKVSSLCHEHRAEHFKQMLDGIGELYRDLTREDTN